MFQGLFFLLALLLPSCSRSRTFSVAGWHVSLSLLSHLQTHNCWGSRCITAPHRRFTHTRTWGSPQRDLPVDTWTLESPSFIQSCAAYIPSLTALLLYLLQRQNRCCFKKKKKQTQKIFKSNIDFLRLSTVPLSLNLHHLHKFDWLDILLHWSFRNFGSFNAFFLVLHTDIELSL